jgi:hypothetical protein
MVAAECELSAAGLPAGFEHHRPGGDATVRKTMDGGATSCAIFLSPNGGSAEETVRRCYFTDSRHSIDRQPWSPHIWPGGRLKRLSSSRHYPQKKPRRCQRDKSRDFVMRGKPESTPQSDSSIRNIDEKFIQFSAVRCGLHQPCGTDRLGRQPLTRGPKRRGWPRLMCSQKLSRLSCRGPVLPLSS